MKIKRKRRTKKEIEEQRQQILANLSFGAAHQSKINVDLELLSLE